MAKILDERGLKELRKSAMSLFTGPERAANHYDNEQLTEQNEEDFKNRILTSITETGTATKEINIIVGNKSQILDFGSGNHRIQRGLIKKFSLILSQPENLYTLSNLQVRCCLCHSVISYPSWYYCRKYAVNHFHYFICFDSSSPLQPSTKCYRRD